MQYKELNDEQFIKLIKESSYFNITTRITKVLVRNTLDYYQEKPIHTMYTVDKNNFPCDPNIRNNIFTEEYINKEIQKLEDEEIFLYNKIKEYKTFFGLDVTKNVMVTIEYLRPCPINLEKYIITYIV